MGGRTGAMCPWYGPYIVNCNVMGFFFSFNIFAYIDSESILRLLK